MKNSDKKFYGFAFLIVLLFISNKNVKAQSWNLTGNSGTTAGTNFIGTTDAKDFVFKTNNTEKGRVKSNGQWQFGETTNLAKIDSGGNLSFAGNAAYKVAGNKYAFQYAGNPNYGLFFNSTNVQYEFRNGSATPVFLINANSGNSVCIGTLKVGAYTLPATDGTNGQVLKTNGTGSLSWSADNSSSGGSTWLQTGNDIYNSNTANVGIGTLTPLYKLHVTGSINTDSVYRIGGNVVLSVKGTANTYAGIGSGVVNTTGSYNTSLGFWALHSNSTGGSNTAIGASALYNNTTGGGNIAIGNSALQNNTIGTQNTAIGNGALFYNIAGNGSVAIGYNAMYYAFNYTTQFQSNNVAIGYEALRGSVTPTSNTGGNNIAIGYQAMVNNTSGSANTAIGKGALGANTTGSSNVANGFAALSSNTTGTQNTANGHLALYNNTTATSNTAYGYSALFLNNTGYNNTAVGANALYGNTTGTNNTAIGQNAGDYHDNNSATTLIGYFADVSANGLTNCIAIGGNSNLAISVSNRARIGNSAITSIGGQVGWSTISDKRVKTDVKENVPGLSFINELRPVTYVYDKDKEDELMGFVDSSDYAEKYDIEKIHFSGFLAQEVESAANKIGYEFSGVDKPGNEKDFYGLRYAEFVVPLVKAVQELDSLNSDLTKSNSELKTELAELKKQMQQFDQSLTQCCTNYQSNVSSPSLGEGFPKLEQNIPNPFSQNSVIKYYLPQTAKSGVLKIYSMEGVELKAFAITQTGFSQITITGNSLASGVYVYTLIIDGKAIDTKQMILTKN